MKTLQEYILKNQEIFVGLEDSKKSWKICVRSGGVIVKEISMPAQYEILRNFFKNKFPDCKINVIYEAGFKGFGLYDQLTADGRNCIVTPPHTVTEEKCQRQKNDKIDARRLSKVLENNDYKKCWIPDKELREDRQIARVYGQIQRDITRVCNRIRKTLEFHGIDDYSTAGNWTKKNYRDMREILKTMDISRSLIYSVEILYQELDKLWELKKNILKQLKELGQTERYEKSVKLLKTVPGIGYLTAIRLTLEWGDIHRFKTRKEFAKFLGLIPGDYSTGEIERKGHITKQGNRYVRSWLVESAWVAIRHDPVLLDKFRRVSRNNKIRKIAITAVARMLAMRIRAVLLKEEPYIIGLVEG
ncbi:MAG: IS110 family transposase [Promethearchaeota archaeon]